MNLVGILFTIFAGYAVITRSRRGAAITIILAASYMTRGQVLTLGPADLPVTRILIFIGFVRAFCKGENLPHGFITLDRILIAYGAVLLVTAPFHSDAGLVFRLGLIWTELGSYFLFRIFIRSEEDVWYVGRAICLLLTPLAAAMLFEKVSGQNLFASLGGVWEHAAVRDGRLRAQGPFAHAILAGMVGVVICGIGCALMQRNRRVGWAGIGTGLAIVFASGSSGPLLSLAALLGAISFWRFRRNLRALLWTSVVILVALDIVMNDPVYFLVARIDITGGSTGWHRAALIQGAMRHFSEWWFVGTDHTRHWMPTGIHANEHHTDLTNHFIQVGVWGGLLLLTLYIAVIMSAFRLVRVALLANHTTRTARYLAWVLGCVLFAYLVNSFSISYFDPSVIFFYFVLGLITAMALGHTVQSSTMEVNKKRSLESVV